MLATSLSTFRKDLKAYCDYAYTESEPVIVTRKENKNLVLLSLDEYNSLIKIAKAKKYWDEVDKGFSKVRAGEYVEHDLLEVEGE